MSQIFHVSGTSCQSCEVVIERELKALPGITAVSVSHAKQEIRLEGSAQYGQKKLNHLLASHGYHVSVPGEAPTKARFNWRRFGGVVVLVGALYLLLDSVGILRFSPSGSDPAGFFAVFVIGLVASVSSCTAVVGGLVMAVSSSQAARSVRSSASRFRSHLFFNTGRVLGFAGFGALVGLLGSSLQLSSTMNGIFVIAIAFTMILLGANLLELFPNNLVRMPKALAHRIHRLSESDDPKAPFILGALTFFLPCGFTQSMQLYALTLQDPLQASAVMTIFALGTLPALLGIGGLTSFSSKKTLGYATRAAGALVLVLGIANAINGLALLGLNPHSAFATAADAPPATVANGVQYIQMEITDQLEYAPNVLTVQAGIPVEWSVFGGEFLGCANSLVSPGLGVNAHLNSGINTIRFTPPTPGKYLFSCSMGMFRGTMIVTEPQS